MDSQNFPVVLVLMTVLTLPTLAASKALPDCVSSCSGQTDGDYQSCLGCHVYVTCSNQLMYDNRPCPAGLVWDDNVKRCEWTSETCGQDAGDPPNCVSSCSGQTDGDYQSCLGCHVYVTCSNQLMYDNRPCPAGLVWDDNVKRCEWTSKTCGQDAEDPANCVSSCSGQTDGDYQSCLGCHVYVTCSNQLMYDNRPCPAGLVWDDNVKRCEWTSETCGQDVEEDAQDTNDDYQDSDDDYQDANEEDQDPIDSSQDTNDKSQESNDESQDSSKDSKDSSKKSKDSSKKSKDSSKKSKDSSKKSKDSREDSKDSSKDSKDSSKKSKDSSKKSKDSSKKSKDSSKKSKDSSEDSKDSSKDSKDSSKKSKDSSKKSKDSSKKSKDSSKKSKDSSEDSQSTNEDDATICEEVECSSWKFAYAECPSNKSFVTVSLVNQVSDSDCDLGTSYGVSDRGLWVDAGCRGVFKACQCSSTSAISCDSWNFRYAECPVTSPETIYNVKVTEKRSVSDCEFGTSFGTNDQGLWVDKGCRGLFEVCSCSSRQMVNCDSWKFKYAECSVNAPNGILQVTVSDKRSVSDCIFGESYGINKNGIWVDKGCRAAFEVCLN